MDVGEASGGEQSKQPSPGTSDVGTPSGPRAALREVMKGHPGAILQLLGPGLITGASDDDPSGIGTYAQVGSQFGFGLLWSALFTFPLMAAVQETCARIALQTGAGLGVALRRRFPGWLVGGAVLALLIANTINIGADLGAIAAGAGLLIGDRIPSVAIVIGAAALIVALQLWATYQLIFRIFKWLTLALFAYVITAFMTGAKLGDVLKATVVPHLELSPGFLAAIVAVLGTTISPYLFFWQASSEVDEMKAAGEERRRGDGGVRRSQLTAARVDIVTGMLFSNVVMYFIILTSAAALHVHGKTQIQTAADAAAALQPFAGHFASVLFAAGLIGTGLLAVPILSGSAAYALKELLKLPGSLASKPSRRPTFYAIMIGATAAGVGIDLLGVNPITALFLTAVLNGIVAPPLLILIAILASDRGVMHRRTSGPLSKVLTWAAAAVMSVAALILIGLTVLGQH